MLLLPSSPLLTRGYPLGEAIAGREDALTISRLPAVRLREILGSPFQGDDAGRQ